MRVLLQVLLALVLFVVGAATAVATVAVHARWWGLLLGVAATSAALLALPRGWSTRLPFGLGWVGVVALVVPPRDEGDYVVSSNTSGYLLIGFALVVLVFSLATLPRPRRASPPG